METKTITSIHDSADKPDRKLER